MDATSAPLTSRAASVAASAACFDLLGRAGTPAEVAEFLQERAENGQLEAVRSLIGRRAASQTNATPSILGLQTASGQTQATVSRTASLYRGNAAINPDNRASI